MRSTSYEGTSFGVWYLAPGTKSYDRLTCCCCRLLFTDHQSHFISFSSRMLSSLGGPSLLRNEQIGHCYTTAILRTLYWGACVLPATAKQQVSLAETLFCCRMLSCVCCLQSGVLAYASHDTSTASTTAVFLYIQSTLVLHLPPGGPSSKESSCRAQPNPYLVPKSKPTPSCSSPSTLQLPLLLLLLLLLRMMCLVFDRDDDGKKEELGKDLLRSNAAAAGPA